MKNLAFILLFIFPIMLQSQPKKVILTEIIKLDSTPQTEIYIRCKEWITTNFKSAKSVIQIDDKENGLIILKGAVPVKKTDIVFTFNAGLMFFTLKMYFKDNKFKYELTDIYHDATTADNKSQQGGRFENENPECGRLTLSKGQWNSMKEQAYSQITALTQRLHNEMTKKKKPSVW